MSDSRTATYLPLTQPACAKRAWVPLVSREVPDKIGVMVPALVQRGLAALAR